jgi:diguanylate cyclase (GGDEF)-like protein
MGKGPTRRQGPGKASETVRTIKKASRELDPHLGSRRGGYHDNPVAYDRNDNDEEIKDGLDLYQIEEEPDPHAKIVLLERALLDAHEEIKTLQRDCVSGLAVRATFEKHIEGVFNARRCQERPLGILMIDIDMFKLVNDNHGHRVGDEVIAQVARVVRECTRTTDLVARYGGEEFVVVVAEAKLAGLTILAERIRASVESLDQEGLPAVTVSIGFTTQHIDDTSGWDLVERADKNLYHAKETGRNKVCHETLDGPELKLILKIEEVRDAPEKEDAECQD